ncbi:MAG: peptide chain release factor N(5)-glutamine methyltransferase [Candidatus Riflebacteria bacterium]|nr:peptide chain release factor N(5)-glutamine methyltransferase [Candidatus Riflebacteria bacterium]MBR4569964.1 peptide chain release factor N(5)-glutamine methyltransferase [Candidatus Riflebacteria bacterium]
MTFQTIKALLNDSVQTLEKAGIEDAKFNVNLIASKALGIEYTKLPLHWSETPSDTFINQFQQMVTRRLAHEPLQYILGEWGFLDFDVNVGEGALIPRPETEEVFLAAVEAIKANSIKSDFKFADVGTGTGILGLAMAKYFQESIGYLVDVSDKALEVAKSNLQKYSELNPRLNLIKSDLLEVFQVDSLDVIISNPPYIDSEEVKSLMPEVLDYEPLIALDGGKNGLELINKLLKQTEKVLKNKGLFVFEHGHGQRNEIKKLISPCWKVIKAGNDFADKERFFVLQLCKG